MKPLLLTGRAHLVGTVIRVDHVLSRAASSMELGIEKNNSFPRNHVFTKPMVLAGRVDVTVTWHWVLANKSFQISDHCHSRWHVGTRWVPDRYKCDCKSSYNPYKWPKLNGYFTLLITCFCAHLVGRNIFKTTKKHMTCLWSIFNAPGPGNVNSGSQQLWPKDPANP